jgi:hypothetical protein
VKYSTVVSKRKSKRKLRSQRRKFHKKHLAIINTANYALENNLVRNLTKIEVPLYSIAVLSYGPGWIPPPEKNIDQLKVDAFNAANKQSWAAMFEDIAKSNTQEVPLSLLKNDVTSPAPLVQDTVINQARDAIRNFATNVSPEKCKHRLNKFEKEGLQWLKTAVRTRKIAITQADKGGCILIVYPDLILSSTKAKLNDTTLYKPLGKSNPLPDIRGLLISMWKYAVTAGFVTAEQSAKTVGLYYKPAPEKSNPFSQSTSDKFKPGICYPYPVYKIHKCSPSQLDNPNVKLPVRLITDLHDGVTVRSDKFLVWKWLAPLCTDYAVDLVKDSTEALLKLEDLEKRKIVSDDVLAFSLDVVSLYESLKFDVVRMALNDAMDCCRPEWDSEFRDWLIDMVIESFKCAVVNFQGDWYGVEELIPTGAVPSVSIANISVYYVFKCLVYNQESRLLEFLRFVDDGCGFFNGSVAEFNCWFESLRVKSVDRFGLDLTCVVNKVSIFTQFLDIQFKIVNGILTTDIFRKETDANRYLYYNSFHPRHVFRSIVYSQALRYRRIINDDCLLRERLDQLSVFFIKSGYPDKLVNSVFNVVSTKPRSLAYKPKTEKDFVVPWISTYGPGFDESKLCAKEVDELLKLSDTWKDKNVRNVIQVVPRRAPNLKDLLFKRKAIALGHTSENGTVPCNATNCQSCLLVSNSVFLDHKGKQFKTVGGTCKSFNLIYCFQCKICDILYVGKTVDALHERVNGHRSKFYGVMKHRTDAVEFSDDEQILGIHLVHHHSLKKKDVFNENYRLFILGYSNPRSIRKSEQFWINKLKTLAPFGLNQNCSVGTI